MSTTTGNVKISQLNELSAISDGAKLKIPVSNNSGSSSTPNWESYSVNAEVLSDFLETSLGLTDVGSRKGLRSKVKDLQTQTREYPELAKKLGKYDLVSKIALSANKSNKSNALRFILRQGGHCDRRAGCTSPRSDNHWRSAGGKRNEYRSR